ncbi:MAG: carboxypeptidase-like regulatory domain-containing protein [Bacteroidota bacterium]
MHSYKRYIVLIIAFTVGNFAQIVLSQDEIKQKVSISFNNEPISEIIEFLEKTYDLNFIYSKEMVDLSPGASIKVNNSPVREVLDQLFSGTNIRYVYKKSYYLLYRLDENSEINRKTNKDVKLISGKVVNSSNDALPFANVYFSNTNIGSATDRNGLFSLEVPKHWSEKIIFSFVGYTTQEIPIRLWKNGMIIKLEKTSLSLNPITVDSKVDRNWEKNLKKFEETFLGSVKNSRFTEISNPWVISFIKHNGKLYASAEENIVINNYALGLILNYHLTEFVLRKNGKFKFSGNCWFESMNKDNPNLHSDWMEKRREIYKGSLTHFFKCLLDDELDNSDFEVFSVRWSDRVKAYVKGDVKAIRKLRKQALIGKYIKSNDWIEVYMEDVIALEYKNKRTYMWQNDENTAIRFDRTGRVINKSNLYLSGYLAMVGVSHLLPWGYEPE